MNRNLNSYSPRELLDQLKSGSDVARTHNAAVKYHETESSESRNDEDLIDLYAECQAHGLSFKSNPKEFLDNCRRLSILLFRYGRSREANNYLLFLRDLSKKESLPAWVWSYSAKLEYMQDLSFCIERPQVVLEFLRNSLEIDQNERQAHAVFAEYILLAVNYFKVSGSSQLTENFSDEIYRFLDSFPLQSNSTIREAVGDLDEVSDLLIESEAPEHTSSATKTAADIGQPDEHESSEISGPELSAHISAIEEELNQKITILEGEKLNLQLQLEIHLSDIEKLRETIRLQEELIDGLQRQEQPSSDKGKALSKELDEHPQKTDTSIINRIDGSVIPKRAHILVIGDSNVGEQHLLGICKSLNIEKNQVRFNLSFKAFDTIDIRSLEYNDSIAGILIGPVPHKVPGCDDPANFLINEKGFPHTIKITTASGKLSITKTAFRDALETLLVNIAATDATVH